MKSRVECQQFVYGTHKPKVKPGTSFLWSTLGHFKGNICSACSVWHRKYKTEPCRKPSEVPWPSLPAWGLCLALVSCTPLGRTWPFTGNFPTVEAHSKVYLLHTNGLHLPHGLQTTYEVLFLSSGGFTLHSQLDSKTRWTHVCLLCKLPNRAHQQRWPSEKVCVWMATISILEWLLILTLWLNCVLSRVQKACSSLEGRGPYLGLASCIVLSPRLLWKTAPGSDVWASPYYGDSAWC